MIKKIIIIVLIYLILNQAFFIVPSGEVAVVTTLGKVSSGSRRAGLNFKIPFIQSVLPFDIKTQVQPEKFETLTKDLEVIRATATIKYSLKPGQADFTTLLAEKILIFIKSSSAFFTQSFKICFLSIRIKNNSK